MSFNTSAVAKKQNVKGYTELPAESYFEKLVAKPQTKLGIAGRVRKPVAKNNRK